MRTTRWRWLYLALVAAPAARAPASEKAPVRLAEIVVTPARLAQDVHDVPAGIQVISEETIRRANAVRLDHVLQHAAGLDLQGGAFPGSPVKVNLRGLTTGYQSERVLVLMDGRRVNDPYQGNTELALLPLDSVERIEILRGPASALYGSNAEGGVINIITRQGRIQPLTRLSLAAGSHDTLRALLCHGWKTGRFDYFLAGSILDTEGYTDNADGTDRDWTARNLAGNFGWAIHADSELRLRLGGYAAQGTDENSDRHVRRDYEDLLYTLNRDPGGEQRFVARVYRNGVDDEYDWKSSGPATYRLSTLVGLIQQTWRLHERHLATIGLEGRQDVANITEILNRVEEESETFSVYIQDVVRVSESVQVTLGLRDDDSEDHPHLLSPRLGVLWQATDETAWFGSIHRAHRAPSLADRFVRTVFNGVLFEGNPDLDAETLIAYEAGARWTPTGPARGSLTVFYNDLNDVFEFMLDPDGVFRNYNVAQEETYGLEATAEFDFTTNLSAFLNYTWTEGTYEKFPSDPAVEGNRLAYLAKHKVSGGLEYAAQRGFVARLEGRYTGPREGDARHTPANRLEDHLVLDGRLRIPLSRRLTATFSVENLGNTHYQDFPGQDQPGRTFMMGMDADL